MTRSWFEIQAKKDAADVWIYDEIGLWGITAGQFINEIKGHKGKTLNLYLNSPGGDVFDGIAIYNSLKNHGGPVNVVVDGVAASIASVIAQAGDTRTMAKASTMMIHEPSGIAMGNSSTMAKMKEELDLLGDNIAGVYADRAGGTSDEWRAKMAAETWYKAQDAVDAGLADGVVTDKQTASAYAGRIFNLSKFNKVPDWVPQVDETPDPTITFSDSGTLSASSGNLLWTDSNGTTTTLSTQPGEEPVSQTQEDTMSDLAAIRQALGLDDEGDILAAVNSLKDAAKDIATGEKGVENKLQRELSEARQAHLTETSKLTQEILSLRDRTRQKEAEYVVDTAIQQGRVAPKDRDMSLKLALNDAEAFKAFASTLRVDLNERGVAMDAQMAEIEPSREEIEVSRSTGVTREDLMKEKAREKGITLPA